MSLEKYDLAKSIYVEGYNYYDYDDSSFGFVSLQDLTQSATIGYTDYALYNLYSDYFINDDGAGDFVDSLIKEAFDKKGQFMTATGNQRRLAVKIAISSFISYMSSLEALHYAVSKCGSNTATALTAWDGGVALLIGSVEGTEKGGDSNEQGQFFYSLGKLAFLQYYRFFSFHPLTTHNLSILSHIIRRWLRYCSIIHSHCIPSQNILIENKRKNGL